MPSASPATDKRGRAESASVGRRGTAAAAAALMADAHSRDAPSVDGQSGDVTFQLDFGEPTEELQEYARRHLGENPDTRAEAISELRNLIYERGEAMPHRLDDAYLLRFLRARHFSVEKAHSLLANYCSFREQNPQLHEGANPDDCVFLGEERVLQVLPYRDQLGRRVLIFKIGNWNPSKTSVDELFKATLIILEMAILEAQSQILGGVCIFDLGGLSLQHAWQVTPSVATRVIQLMGASFPIRTQAIHIVNQSWVFDMVFAIFKPLLDERMRERVHFHGDDYESLHQFIDPKFLPEELGGDRPEYTAAQWVSALRLNPFIIQEMRDLGYYVTDKPELSEAADQQSALERT